DSPSGWIDEEDWNAIRHPNGDRRAWAGGPQCVRVAADRGELGVRIGNDVFEHPITVDLVGCLNLVRQDLRGPRYPSDVLRHPLGLISHAETQIERAVLAFGDPALTGSETVFHRQ